MCIYRGGLSVKISNMEFEEFLSWCKDYFKEMRESTIDSLVDEFKIM